MELISTLEIAVTAMRECGAMQAVMNMENEVAKERRRMRACSRESPYVMEALATRRDAERARERRQMAAVADANARTLSLSLSLS